MNLTTQSNSKTRRKKKKCVYNTWCSQAVTHLSTNHARPCLTSVFGREPVYSGWYGRRHRMAVLNSYILMLSEKCLCCAQAVRTKRHLSLSSRTLRPRQLSWLRQGSQSPSHPSVLIGWLLNTRQSYPYSTRAKNRLEHILKAALQKTHPYDFNSNRWEVRGKTGLRLHVTGIDKPSRLAS